MNIYIYWIGFSRMTGGASTVEEWTKMAELSFPMGEGCTGTVVELEACLSGVCYDGDAAVATYLENWRPLDTSRFRLLELSGLLG